MKKLLLVFLVGVFCSQVSAQVGVADSLVNDVFTIRVNGDIIKAMPKNCCYSDKNSAGNIAIKITGSDKTVTSYQAPSVYEINGDTSSVADTVMNRLYIIMTKLESTLKTKD